MLIMYLQMLDTPEEKIRFEQIYLKYREKMFHVADSILHNDQDAEEDRKSTRLNSSHQF